jgi:hypothetical protein
MSGAIPPLPPYAFMAWCSVKAQGAPFSWLEKPRNRMGRDLDCMADVLMGFHLYTFPKSIQTVFSRSGWSVIRSASLFKGGTSKKRP